MAFFIVFSCFLLYGSAGAQGPAGGIGGPGLNMPVTLRYRQELNNHLWQFDAGRVIALSPRWEWRFQEQFRTSMLRLGGNDDKWKDDHSFSTALGYLLLPSLRVETLFRSLSFFDRQTGFNNDIRSQAVGWGMQFTPAPRLRLAAQAGPRWESRMGFHDQGIFLAGEGALSALDLGGYLNHLQGLLEMDHYDVRKNHEANIAYAVARVFSPASSDSLRIYNGSRRRDNYTSLIGDVESQREGNKGFENILTYGLGAWSRLLLRTSWQFRNVELVSFGTEEAARQRKRNDRLGDHLLEMTMARPRHRHLEEVVAEAVVALALPRRLFRSEGDQFHIAELPAGAQQETRPGAEAVGEDVLKALVAFALALNIADERGIVIAAAAAVVDAQGIAAGGAEDPGHGVGDVGLVVLAHIVMVHLEQALQVIEVAAEVECGERSFPGEKNALVVESHPRLPPGPGLGGEAQPRRRCELHTPTDRLAAYIVVKTRLPVEK